MYLYVYTVNRCNGAYGAWSLSRADPSGSEKLTVRVLITHCRRCPNVADRETD